MWKIAGQPFITRSAAMFNCLVSSACLMLACGTQQPPAMMPTPSLPSKIPSGVYSGTLEVTVTTRFDGEPETQIQSTPFTFVIDGSGRLLDADGNAFEINRSYFVDANPLAIELFSRSITVLDEAIVLRFDLAADYAFGDTTGEMTGSQTDTLTYHGDSDTLELVRSQIYGGELSNGTSVHLITEGRASLHRS